MDENYLSDIPVDLKAEINYDLKVQRAEWQRAEALMKNNKQQFEIWKEMKSLIDDGNPKGYYFFVDGPGGTGKTMLFNALLSYVRSKPLIGAEGRHHIAVSVAASGIASLLLRGGRTVHNRFGLGGDVTAATTCNYNIDRDCARTQILRRAEIILWDEASMSCKSIVNAVDLCLRDILDCDKPFGGKLLVFGGDFRQTLSVVEGGNRAQEVDTCLKKSPLRKGIMVRKLTLNMHRIG